MPKLRHIAITVPDMEAAAQFYEKTFGLSRSMESPIAILLTDGVMSLAILKFQTDQQPHITVVSPTRFVEPNHFVDDFLTDPQHNQRQRGLDQPQQCVSNGHARAGLPDHFEKTGQIGECRKLIAKRIELAWA